MKNLVIFLAILLGIAFLAQATPKEMRSMNFASEEVAEDYANYLMLKEDNPEGSDLWEEANTILNKGFVTDSNGVTDYSENYADIISYIDGGY